MNSVLQYIPHFVDAIFDSTEYQLQGDQLVNRMNAQGVQLELFIRNTLAGIKSGDSSRAQQDKISRTFSYTGNANNIPDLILREGDAIEVKKIKRYAAPLALNSSPPKAALYANDTRISKAAREADTPWECKDIYYAVGWMEGDKLSSLCFIDGALYAASKDSYTRVADAISEAVQQCEGVQFTDTNELGKVKRVDPLGRTDLRIRGMWHIEGVFHVFQDIISNESNKFNFSVLADKKKYDSLPKEYKEQLENNSRLVITSELLPHPDNGAQSIEAVVIQLR